MKQFIGYFYFISLIYKRKNRYAKDTAYILAASLFTINLFSVFTIIDTKLEFGFISRMFQTWQMPKSVIGYFLGVIIYIPIHLFFHAQLDKLPRHKKNQMFRGVIEQLKDKRGFALMYLVASIIAFLYCFYLLLG
jgi:hypothetical protein